MQLSVSVSFDSIVTHGSENFELETSPTYCSVGSSIEFAYEVLKLIASRFIDTVGLLAPMEKEWGEMYWGDNPL